MCKGKDSTETDDSGYPEKDKTKAVIKKRLKYLNIE